MQKQLPLNPCEALISLRNICRKNTVKRSVRASSVFVVYVLLLICMGGGSSKDEMSLSAPIVVAAKARPKATLIFLHGLGDTGQGWSAALKQLKLKNIKCVCPTAPIQSVTLNAGFKMPSWFDIMSLSPDGVEDREGILAASNLLQELISEEEKNGVSSENVFVGGFSQGGAVAMYTALTLDRPLGGVVGLSTWLPLHKDFPEALKNNGNIPIFQGHGTLDPLVPMMWGEMTAKLVKTMTSKHEFKTYPMQHCSCDEEMEDVKKFLTSIVNEED